MQQLTWASVVVTAQHLLGPRARGLVGNWFPLYSVMTAAALQRVFCSLVCCVTIRDAALCHAGMMCTVHDLGGDGWYSMVLGECVLVSSVMKSTGIATVDWRRHV